MELVWYIVPGLVVGLLVGATGVGGGSIMTPVLTTGFGIPPAIAVGTDLVFAALTKTAGTFTHRIQDSVDWRIAGMLCLGSLPAAGLTILLMKHFGVANKSALIEISLSVALIFTAVAMLLGKQFGGVAKRFGVTSPRKAAIGTVISGVVLGALVSVTSVGAGALGATLILTLHPRLSVIKVAGTDIAHAVPLTAIAGLGHIWLGTVNFSLLTGLLIGSIPGIIIGSLIGKRLPETILRRVLAITLIAVAANLLLKRVL
ncbi:MAG TPA: sulfite exporter TauE/SafE family protein [Burkholderiales bacterium]|nr:sulfite exporter TauE/SafE family protein [Burkholderiales bacterium]